MKGRKNDMQPLHSKTAHNSWPKESGKADSEVYKKKKNHIYSAINSNQNGNWFFTRKGNSKKTTEKNLYNIGFICSLNV